MSFGRSDANLFFEKDCWGDPSNDQDKILYFPETASCFQSGPFPLPHWELLCSGLPSTSPGPSNSLPSHPHPAPAGRCQRVRTCERLLRLLPTLSSLTWLTRSSNATPPRHIFQGPTHFSSTPPPRPAPTLCVSQALLSLSILRGLHWVCIWRIVPQTLQGGALS